MKKEISEIKRRALLAKQRLKMGYWQKIHKERLEFLSRTNDCGRIEVMNNQFRNEYKRVNSLALGDDFAEREEKLYLRVCNILDEDENIVNPIGRLADKCAMEKMDEANRQRYILELSAKFRELRERYYREKAKDI